MYLIDVGNIWANQNIIKKKAKPLFYITYYDMITKLMTNSWPGIYCKWVKMSFTLTT